MEGVNTPPGLPEATLDVVASALATKSRSRKPAAKMHDYMQQCARDGASKARVDAAMTEGYRLAGERPAGTPTAPVTTPSSGATENLLSKYARDSRNAE